jgi:hypothetical protein
VTVLPVQSCYEREAHQLQRTLEGLGTASQESLLLEGVGPEANFSIRHPSCSHHLPLGVDDFAFSSPAAKLLAKQNANVPGAISEACLEIEADAARRLPAMEVGRVEAVSNIVGVLAASLHNWNG